MKLDRYYTIKKDAHNIILCFEQENWSDEKNKIVRSYNETYHANLEQAIRAYIGKVVDPSQDAKDILRKLDEVHVSLSRLINEKPVAI